MTAAAAAKRKKRKRSQVSAPASASLVYNNAPLIRAFAKVRSPSARQEILRAAPETVRAFSSLAHNTMRGVVPVPNRSTGKKLLSNREFQALASPALSISKKRQLLMKRGGQKGGFLPVLLKVLPAAISIASGLISGVASYKKRRARAPSIESG